MTPLLPVVMALDLGLGSVSLEVKLDLSKIRSDLTSVFSTVESSGFTSVNRQLVIMAGEVVAANKALRSFYDVLNQVSQGIVQTGTSGSKAFANLGTSIAAVVPHIVAAKAAADGFDSELLKAASDGAKLEQSGIRATNAWKTGTTIATGATASLTAALIQSGQASEAVVSSAHHIANAWQNTGGTFGAVLHGMTALAQSSGAVLVDTLNHRAADTVAAAWRRTRTTFDGVTDAMRAQANATGAAIVNALGNPNLSGIARAGDRAMDALRSRVQEGLAGIRAFFSRPIGEMTIGGFAVGQMGIDALKNAFQNLFQFVQQGYQNMASALIGFTGKALGEASKISKSLNVVKSLTGDQNTGELQKAIIVAGIASTQETGAIAAYSEQLAKSGLAQKEISLALRPIALLADASGEEIGKTGKAVISAGNAYQLGAKDMAQTSATLLAASTSAQNSTIAGYGKFSQYFKVQSATGQEGLKRSAEIYALLKSGGSEDAAAGRNIASFYKALANPSKKNSAAQESINAALKSINSGESIGGFDSAGKARNETDSLLSTVRAYKQLKSAKSDAFAQDLFGNAMGVEAMRQIQAMANQSEEQIAKTLGNVRRKIESTDLVEIFYKQATSGLAGAQKLLTGAIDGFTAAYGLSLEGAAGTTTGLFAIIASSIASTDGLFAPLEKISEEFTAFAKTDAFKQLAVDLTELGKSAITEGIAGMVEIFRELQIEFGGTGTLAQSLGVALRIPLRGFLLITGGIKDLIVMASQVRKAFSGLFSGEMFGGGENPMLKMFGPDVLGGFSNIKTALSDVGSALMDGLGVLAPPILSVFSTGLKFIGETLAAISPYFSAFIRYLSATTSVGLYQVSAAFKVIASVLSPVLTVVRSVGVAISEISKVGLTAFTAGILNAFRGFFDLGNAIDSAIGSPLKNLGKSFETVVKGFGSGARGFAIDAGRIGGTLASFFVSPGAAVTSFGKALSAMLSIERFGNFSKAVATLVEVLTGGLGKAIGGFRFPAFANIGNPFGALKLPDYLKPSVDLLVNPLKGFLDLFKGSFSQTFDLLAKSFKDLGSSGGGATFADLGKALEPLAKPALLAIINSLRISIVSLMVAVEALKLAFVLVSGGIQLSVNALVTTFRIAFEAIKTAGLVAFEGIKITWNTIAGILKAGAQLLSGDFSGAFETVKSTASSNFESIGFIFKTIFGGLGNIAQIAMEGAGRSFDILKNTGGSALGQLGQIFSAAWAGFSSIVGDTLAAMGINFSGFTSSISAAWATATEGLKIAWGAVDVFLQLGFTTLSAAWSSFTTAFTFGWSTAVSSVQAAWDTLEFAIESGIGSIGSAWNAMCSALGSAFQGVITAIQGAMDSLIGTVNSVASGISDGIGGAANGLVSTFSNVRSAIESWMSPINNAIGGLQQASQAMGQYASQAANAVGSAAQSFTNPIAQAFSGFGFASGGVLPGYSRTDDTLIMARSGEGIIVPEAVRLLGGPQGVDRLNRSSEGGSLPKFATGGVVGSALPIRLDSPELQKILDAMAAITRSFPEVQKVILALGSSITPELLNKLGSAIGKLSASTKASLSSVVNAQLGKLAGSGGEGISAIARSLGSSVSDAMKPAIIAQQAFAAGLTKAQTAYVLATAQHESDQFRTMTEYASGADYEGRSDLGNTQAGDGVRFKGRGFVQLTGRANYAKYAQKLGIDLVNRPELAEIPEIAAKILINGMKTGAFTGVGLKDFSGSNFEAMRAIVNGSDQAGKIADYARKYAGALETLGSIGAGVTGSTLNALNTIARASKGGAVALGDGLKAAIAKIPVQYRSAIESVLAGTTKTLPSDLAGYLSQLIPNLTSGSLGGGVGVGNRLLATAKSFVGREFNPGVFAQCAAFVRDVFSKAGMGLSETLSRSADGQDYGVLEAGSFLKSSIGQIIKDKSKIMAGDIVMWSKTYGDFGNDITHVGIATGNGMMIDRSTSSAPVRERPIDTFSNFVAAVRPATLKGGDVGINAEALKAGLSSLGSKLSGIGIAQLRSDKKNTLDILKGEIEKLQAEKSAISQTAKDDRYGARLKSELQDMAALKSKIRAAEVERERKDALAVENARIAIANAKTPKGAATAQIVLDALLASQPVAVARIKAATAEQLRKAQEAIDRVNDLISTEVAKKGVGLDITRLKALEDLQRDFFDKKITDTQLQEKLRSLGVTLDSLGDSVGNARNVTQLVPTMRSLMAILNEGVQSAFDRARKFGTFGNQIERQLQRDDLTQAQRVRALPIAYQQLLARTILPTLPTAPTMATVAPARAASQESVGPREVSVRLETRSIGGEQYVPLTQVQQSLRSVAAGAVDYRYSYSDRLNAGLG